MCFSYLNNRVYVSLANGDICIYYPDTSKSNLTLKLYYCSPNRKSYNIIFSNFPDGSWNTSDPVTINVGSAAVPVSKMLPVGDKLWCSCHNSVKIFDTIALKFEVSLSEKKNQKNYYLRHRPTQSFSEFPHNSQNNNSY